MTDNFGIAVALAIVAYPIWWLVSLVRAIIDTILGRPYRGTGTRSGIDEDSAGSA